MAFQSLPKAEVRKRLIRLRNLERLHEAQRFKIWHLRDENRALRKEVATLRATVTAQQRTIDDLKLQVEELRAIVFGKQRENTQRPDDRFPPAPPVSGTPRLPTSYRRNPPTEAEVTEVTDHLIDRCVHCGGAFAERESKTYIEEDIPIPQKKLVVKHVVERGYCAICHRWSSGACIPPAPVILGANVKRYVCYLSVVCRQSYAQIEDLLKQSYDFHISQGEIAKIVGQEGERLRPEYERLKAKIRGRPSLHLDETTWNVLGSGERGFAWTMVGGDSGEAVFALGKSRGKGNAEQLLGDSMAVVVSDDYAAYRNLANAHQLCCAHIVRKLRDLAISSLIADEIRARCRASYETFAAIYADIETARQSKKPAASYSKLLERLGAFAASHPADPAKLVRVKAQVAERAENYLTCLTHPGVASDNNAAERSLRHLVIKRKISFGSISARTAETMAILLSVLMSWKQRGELRNYLLGV